MRLPAARQEARKALSRVIFDERQRKRRSASASATIGDFSHALGLDRNFCSVCAARLYSSNLESFPGLVFVQLGSLDRPELIEPKLEMFVKRRAKWVKPLDVPQFEEMPR